MFTSSRHLKMKKLSALIIALFLLVNAAGFKPHKPLKTDSPSNSPSPWFSPSNSFISEPYPSQDHNNGSISSSIEFPESFTDVIDDFTEDLPDEFDVIIDKIFPSKSPVPSTSPSPSSTVSVTPSTTPTPIFSDSICAKSLSICYAIDESGSIEDDNFEKLKQFLLTNSKQFFDYLPSAEIGVTYFDYYPRTIQELTSSYNELESSIISSTQNKGKTAIRRALQHCHWNVLRNAEHDKLIILATDGNATDTEAPYGNILRNNNILTVTVGIGKDVNKDRLENEATTPDLYVGIDFENLTTLSRKIIDRVCQATPFPSPSPSSSPCVCSDELWEVGSTCYWKYNQNWRLCTCVDDTRPDSEYCPCYDHTSRVPCSSNAPPIKRTQSPSPINVER